LLCVNAVSNRLESSLFYANILIVRTDENQSSQHCTVDLCTNPLPDYSFSWKTAASKNLFSYLTMAFYTVMPFTRFFCS